MERKQLFENKGLEALTKTFSLASVQASWRFYNNKNVKFEDLNQSILEQGVKDINQSNGKYVLYVTDWSQLDYKTKSAKKDLKSVKNDKGNAIFYDLQSTIAVDSVTGNPIAPLVQNLKTDKEVLSTYKNDIPMEFSRLDELELRSDYINSLNIDKTGVHIVDREGDSVKLFRFFQEKDYKFLIRMRNNNVHYFKEKEPLKAQELASKIGIGKRFKEIVYEGKKVTIYVNETNIEIRRRQVKNITSIDKETQEIIQKQSKISGKAVKGRFILVSLVNSDHKVVTNWTLFTNIEQDVSKFELANWYYFRWRIETYFKLLKSGGFDLEEWLQRDPCAIFRRLLVVSYASLLVWQIKNHSSNEAEKLRWFLFNLSGVQLKRGQKISANALLKGLFVFLTMIDTISSIGIENILKIKEDLNDILGFSFV